MSNNIRSAFRFGFCSLFFLLIASLPAFAGQGTCDTVVSPTKGVPLSGLWEIATYREIHGEKGYMIPGDYVLVRPTLIPGEACVEFTHPVEGSFAYFLAMNSEGTIIDDNVIAANGRDLRVLIETHNGGISIVLYASGSANSQIEGNPDDNGGALASGGRP
ncbi:MAG: hypothetical protein R3F15_19390 [Lysobacterales bacterium]